MLTACHYCCWAQNLKLCLNLKLILFAVCCFLRDNMANKRGRIIDSFFLDAEIFKRKREILQTAVTGKTMTNMSTLLLKPKNI